MKPADALSPTLPADVYTDAPPLLRSLLLAPFQVAFWLLVHPTAWRNALKRIDAGLPPDFCLAGLTPTQWRKSALWRLLLPAWVASWLPPPLLAYLLLLAQGQPAAVCLGGLLTALAFSLGAGLMVGGLVSVGSGLILAFFAGLGTGLAAFHPAWYLLPLAAACGLAGAVQINLIPPGRSLSSSTAISSAFVGLLTAAVVIGFVTIWVDILLPESAGSIKFFSRLSLHPLLNLSGGGLFLMAVFYYIFHLGLSRPRRSSIRLAAISGLLLAGLVLGLLSLPRNTALESLWLTFLGALVLSLVYAAAHAFAGHLGDALAAAVAGTLGAALSFAPLMPLVAGPYSPLPHVTLYAVGMYAAGLTFNTWRPLLLYPLTALYNGLLLMLDRQQASGPLKYFRLHVLFWGETQRVQWYRLERYLVLLDERQPELSDGVFQLAMRRGQVRAVRRARIELAARRMQACHSLDEIAVVHRRLPSGELAGPASELMRQFVDLSHSVEQARPAAGSGRSRSQLAEARARLQEIHNSLIRASQAEAQRFAPIAAAWQRILDEYLAQVEDWELPNPYVCGSPLSASEKVFVGRGQVMRQIEELLQMPGAGSIFLHGQRRTGKTSLLLNLERILPGSMRLAFVDCQAASGTDDYYELSYNVLRQVIRWTQRRAGLRLPELQATGNGNLLQALNAWWDEVDGVLEANQTRLLVCLDEIEAFLPNFERHPDMAVMFFNRVHHLLQERPQLKLLMASSHRLEEMSSWSGYLANLGTVSIGYLDGDEARQLIERPVADFPLRYEPQAVERVLALTRCQPNLLQLLCTEIVLGKNAGPAAQRRLATPGDVEAAAGRALESGGFFFMDYQRQVPPSALPMLRCLARLGPGVRLPTAEWRAACEGDFEGGLDALLRRDLVELTPQGYAFQVELVRRWFADEQH